MTRLTAEFVRGVYSDRVSDTYELVNHVLTCGHDWLWRRRAATIAAVGGGTQWADLCTGTGELAVQLQRLAPPGTTVHGVDFSEPMIETARAKPEAAAIRFRIGDVKSLDFPDDSLDLITIGFATRNINLNRETLVTTLSEFRRVLKPGGRFVNLETSQPSSHLVRGVMQLYVRLFVPLVGGAISGSEWEYAWLRHTVSRFHTPEDFSAIMREAGFTDVRYQPLTGGIVAVHQGVKG